MVKIGFSGIAVYDCTVKPKSSDSASVARIKYLRFTEYLKEFDFLWDTFSKERVQKRQLRNLKEGFRRFSVRSRL